MNGNSALLSIFASNMPPTAEFACATSVSNSAAATFCLIKGLAIGDSNIGSIGSKGLMRWARMQSLGSATSRMLREFWAVFVDWPFSGVGGSTGSWDRKGKEFRK